MRYWLVMPAAGSGRRFAAEAPKQYALLAGRTVIEWALAPFCADPQCEGIVVALAPGDSAFAALGLSARILCVNGGADRSHSVRAGLRSLAARAQTADWVLVHDAARPCLAAQDLQRLLVGLAAHPIGGLLAAPVSDTLKRAHPGTAEEPLARVVRTEERTGLWRALTPQMFRYGPLCAALDTAHAAARAPADEAQALEWSGEEPRLIEGAASNLKITRPEDLLLAAAVLRARATGG